MLSAKFRVKRAPTGAHRARRESLVAIWLSVIREPIKARMQRMKISKTRSRMVTPTIGGSFLMSSSRKVTLTRSPPRAGRTAFRLIAARIALRHLL